MTSIAKSPGIAERVDQVRQRVERACQVAGRDPGSVRIVAASKTRAPREILEVLRAGITDFGENRPEEAEPKIHELAALAQAEGLPLPRWHMIGHVQSRKARLIPGTYSLIHSLDSLPLARRLSQLSKRAGTVLPCLLQVNVSGEVTKGGFDAAAGDVEHAAGELRATLAEITALPGLEVRGLMTMPPASEDPEDAAPHFARLRDLAGLLAEQNPEAAWSELSMGMTEDLEVAIREGTTMIRVGRALFGPRQA